MILNERSPSIGVLSLATDTPTDTDSVEATDDLSFHSAQSEVPFHDDGDSDGTATEHTLLTQVRKNTALARSAMAAKYNATHSVQEFAVGQLVSLTIPSKLRLAFTPSRLFCRVVRKPQPAMHELQCIHGILDTKFPTRELESIPAGITVHIGDKTDKISLQRAVRLMHNDHPNAVRFPSNCDRTY